MLPGPLTPRAAATLLGVLLAAGCATPRPPAELVADPDISLSRRVDALTALDLPRHADVVAHALWDERAPATLRLAALQRLADHDPATLIAQSNHRLVGVNDAEVVAAVCAQLARPFGQAGLPAVVTRWAEPLRWDARSQGPRPEARAFAVITGDDLPTPAALAALVRGGGALDVRLAAWAVLVRDFGDDAARAAVTDTTPRGPDPWLDDLRAAAAVFDELPRDRTGVLWLTLRRMDRAGWSAMEATVRTLGHEHRAGLALRHAAVLGRLTPDAAVRRADALTDTPPAHTTARDDPADRATPVERLSFGDRLLVALIRAAMRDPANVAALFAQADADHADPTGEHGGVVVLDEDARPVFRGLPPLGGGHDRVYIAPPNMLTELFDGVAAYHFHAERHHNADHAGPGRGDRAWAEQVRAAMVILTFLDADTLNVDVVLPDRRGVDLGTITRP